METDTEKLKKSGKDSEKKRIPKICSWCGKIFSIDDWEFQTGHKIHVTHGICPKCFAKEKAEGEKIK